MKKRRKMPLRGSRGSTGRDAGSGDAGAVADGGMRSGAEAVPPGTVQRHVSEHESGYGGRGEAPRTSADEHEKVRPDGSDRGAS
jgi:hypothetical protein